MNRIKRGEVFYVNKVPAQYMSEQEAGRPAVIVSNDMNNEYSEVVEVVYLTTKVKTDLPTHVDVRATGIRSTVLCEQVHSVAKERISDYCGTCTASEMSMIDMALSISLGLSDVPTANKKEVSPVKEPEPVKEQEVKYVEVSNKEDKNEIAKLSAERDVYKSMYENLLERLVGIK